MTRGRAAGPFRLITNDRNRGLREMTLASSETVRDLRRRGREEMKLSQHYREAGLVIVCREGEEVEEVEW